ncbi:MAG: putative dehydrogenase [Phycisphaerales bacterium]|jgi:predicted dehydrogenase
MGHGSSNKPLKYGMVGGGTGAFIGGVHRKAAALDSQAVLIAGAFSSTPEKSLASAKELGLASDRSYGTYTEMFEREAARPEGDRIDFVSIVTPNDSHYPIAKAALEAGVHVVLDKPSTHTSAQSAELAELATGKGLVCCVTYNYTGNAMVRQAAQMVSEGQIGAIRKVFVEYHQGWLATKLEDSGLKQAAWRTDPARAGLGGALGDIGSHAENLVAFITGLQIESLCADLTSFVPGRLLDDDGTVLLRFRGGAKGVLTCSQVCCGCDNSLTIRVYGETGGLAWHQETPEVLKVSALDGSTREMVRGGAGVGGRALAATRTPAGHPEGYLEAFGNIYLGAIEAIRAKMGQAVDGVLAGEIPTIQDGQRGVRFIELCVQSANSGANWVDWSDG